MKNISGKNNQRPATKKLSLAKVMDITRTHHAIAEMGQVSTCTLGVTSKHVERWSPTNNEWPG